jgi:hypothetical protein
MGARTTWEIRTDADSPSIYLYSHWGGDSKWADTADALRNAESRWYDASYGARIFISQIIGDQWNTKADFGITAGASGSVPFEESYFPILIDFSTRSVSVGNALYGFAEFVSMRDNTAEIMAEVWV